MSFTTIEGDAINDNTLVNFSIRQCVQQHNELQRRPLITHSQKENIDCGTEIRRRENRGVRGAARVGAGAGVLVVMHGRSGMTIAIRPSRPYIAGREHVGFFTDQAGIACIKRKVARGIRRVA